ncbi:hypothetical protein GCM10027290_30040 [Micromonospora sonneratiae]|uniref:Uncharacterized protein n=1 Tax=Micromonospora sonneratiae TaxID=1184706 RepID=A0ABW3YFL1_9ACTN
MSDNPQPDQPTEPLEQTIRNSGNAFSPVPPPPAWLTHAVGQLAAHIPTGVEPNAEAAVPLRWLRHRFQEQITKLVIEGHLDITHANEVLDALELPLLARYWEVRVSLPVSIEVTAVTEDDAFDAAEAAIETALRTAELPASIDWDARQRDRATPAAFDPDATCSTPPPGDTDQ